MLLNVQRAALRLGVAEHTVRRWTATGLLPCTRTPGGHRRIREEDVDALAQQIGGSNQIAARRAREREVDTLLETSLALVGQLELPDLLREIARRLTTLMDCHFCAISTYDERAQTVTMLADFDASGRRLPDMGEYALSRFPLTRRVLQERTTAVVNLSDPAADPDELRELRRGGDRSLLMVPLVAGGRSIGLLELMDHLRERRYTRQELRICGAIAGQAAVALQNARSYAEARAAAGRVEELRAAVAALGAELATLDQAARARDLLEAAARVACAALGAASCVVSAGGETAGFAAVREAGGEAAHGAAGWPAPGGAAIVAVRDPSGGPGVTLTVTLPRPAAAGERELLGVVAAVVGSHLRRLAPAPGALA